MAPDGAPSIVEHEVAHDTVDVIAAYLARVRGWCNGCDWTGSTDFDRSRSRLSVENAREFVAFLRAGGGGFVVT